MYKKVKVSLCWGGPWYASSTRLQLWSERLLEHRVVLSFRLKPQGWSSEDNRLWLCNIFYWLVIAEYCMSPAFWESFAVSQYSQIIWTATVYISLSVHIWKWEVCWPRNSQRLDTDGLLQSGLLLHNSQRSVCQYVVYVSMTLSAWRGARKHFQRKSRIACLLLNAAAYTVVNIVNLFICLFSLLSILFFEILHSFNMIRSNANESLRGAARFPNTDGVIDTSVLTISLSQVPLWPFHF